MKSILRFSLAALLLSQACGRTEAERPLGEVVEAARAGDAQALGDLIGRFSHPDRDEAHKAWEAIVDIGDAADGVLIKALESKNPTVAEHSAGALGSRGAKAAVDPLITALEGWTSRRYVAAWALGEIGDARAIPVLIRTMGDENAEVRKYAARSLIKFGPEAVEALLEALGSASPEVRHYAVRALGEIRDERSVESLIAMDGKVDEEVYLWALGRLGDSRGYEKVADAVADGDWRIRLAAIQALKDLGDERAVPLLEEILEDDEWMIREWAARGLESITGNRYRYRNQQGEDVYPYALYR